MALAPKAPAELPKSVEPDRLAEIYVKAAQIFYEHGFDATSMDDLAKAFQLTKPGLYYYIGSKQDLLFSIMKLAMDWLQVEVIEPARNETDPLRRLKLIINRHGRELMEGPHAISILSDEVAALKPRHRRRILVRKREYYALVKETLAELKAEGKLRNVDLTVASFSLFGTLMWLPRWYQSKGRLATEKVLDELFKIIAAGILKEST